ncbi:hypothetical protein AB0L62_12810 [Nocardia asteroides]|uniref:hypothetical protein n=1 Tax=Nocardia asteroides TaxID=1824 RepID=UPI003419EA61
MNASDILAIIAVVLLVLQNAARIVHELTALLDACRPLVHAARELAADFRSDTTTPRDAQPTDQNPSGN